MVNLTERQREIVGLLQGAGISIRNVDILLASSMEMVGVRVHLQIADGGAD